MARKNDLRLQRAGTIINLTSTKQETQLGQALADVVTGLQAEFAIRLQHQKQWLLRDVVAALLQAFQFQARQAGFLPNSHKSLLW